MDDERQPQSAVQSTFYPRCQMCGAKTYYASIVDREDGSCYTEHICPDCEFARTFNQGGVIRCACIYCGNAAPHIILYPDHINTVREPVCTDCEDIHRRTIRRSPRFGYVYLLDSKIGYWKIGRSKTPVKRFRKLDVVLPYDLDVKVLIETPDMHALEKELHNRFEAKRVRGEWFTLEARDVLFIKRMAVLP